MWRWAGYGSWFGSRKRLVVVAAACAAISLTVVAIAAVGASGSRGASRPRVAEAQQPISRAGSQARVELARARRLAERAGQRHRRWLESRAARAQRSASSLAFHGLPAPAAQQLFARDYGSEVAAVTANPAVSLARAGHFVRWRNDHSAFVRGPHGLEVVSSAFPCSWARRKSGHWTWISLLEGVSSRRSVRSCRCRSRSSPPVASRSEVKGFV